MVANRKPNTNSSIIRWIFFTAYSTNSQLQTTRGRLFLHPQHENPPRRRAK
jgi:hypothetical protein